MRQAIIKIIQASGPLMCGRIVFGVREDTENGMKEFYRDLRHGPHGCWVKSADRLSDLEDEDSKPCEFEEALPHGWSYEQFITAYTFWVEGYNQGYDKAAYGDRS